MRPRAVIFDLDGTLTVPLLDFDAIREEIGLPPGLPILEQLAAVSPGERTRAEAILQRHESQAIERATLADGCLELLALLRNVKVPHGILTRNTRQAVARFNERFGLHFDAVYAREDGPPKPSPAGAIALCQSFGVRPREVLSVGDYKFDILAGRAAGCRTVLVTTEPPANLADWGPPDNVVTSLRELLPLWA